MTRFLMATEAAGAELTMSNSARPAGVPFTTVTVRSSRTELVSGEPGAPAFMVIVPLPTTALRQSALSVAWPSALVAAQAGKSCAFRISGEGNSTLKLSTVSGWLPDGFVAMWGAQAKPVLAGGGARGGA